MNDDAHRRVIAAWNEAADHLETFGAEGDMAHQSLLNPTIFALAGAVAGKRTLDAGCGEGYLSRMLAQRGALVTGVEPAARLHALCIEHERRAPQGIAYLQCDLVKLALPPQSFDLVIANMVLMDIPDYRSAIHMLAAMTHPGGNLIITLLHPCFEESGALWPTKRVVETREYLAEFERPQTFATLFHRPLSAYINCLLHEGLALRRIVEPGLPNGVTLDGNDRDAHVPSFIALHMQRSATP
ncbi:MAG TPA: class I SAM-dependent methyltransferase [Ktedonobacterales bacterium]|jgi:2-polyprenyl-3-methyl-5-hydroxy-6-metoxy-1,4-benzoquinol methylase